MTQALRSDLLRECHALAKELDIAAECGDSAIQFNRLSDRELLATYMELNGIESDADYRDTSSESPLFLAVLATAEYHEHWSR